MEAKLARIVNKGFEGEPQNPVLQVKDTLEIFDFSQIKYGNSEADGLVELTIADMDLENSTIQHILNNGHEVNITWDENNIVTLQF
jgi:hypothetical protein